MSTGLFRASRWWAGQGGAGQGNGMRNCLFDNASLTRLNQCLEAIEQQDACLFTQLHAYERAANESSLCIKTDAILRSPMRLLG